jgi:radical SAM-linked protein
LKFIKHQEARFLSHLEVSEALIRAIKRGGLPFIYSHGFHPHPRISFVFATSVGMESREEYADIQVETRGEKPADIKEKINAFLPSGLEIVDVKKITGAEGSLAGKVAGFSYAIPLPQDTISASEMKEKLGDFLRSDAFIITRETKGKFAEKNIRPLVASLFLDEEKHKLLLTVRISSEGTVRPLEILTKVLGLSTEAARTALVIKTKTHFYKIPLTPLETVS